MRVLVTGGAGFIGSHLVDGFLEEGFEVHILDSLDPRVHPHGKPDYIPEKAEFIEGDVRDRKTLRYALRNVDVVCHQAAYQDYMPDFSRFFSVNAVGTALIYELIVRERLPVKKILVASSQSVYGEGQYDCPKHGFFQPAPRSREQLEGGAWEVSCPTCGEPSEPGCWRRSTPTLITNMPSLNWQRSGRHWAWVGCTASRRSLYATPSLRAPANRSLTTIPASVASFAAAR